MGLVLRRLPLQGGDPVDQGDVIQAQARLDLQVFQRIAGALGISARFVGVRYQDSVIHENRRSSLNIMKAVVGCLEF